MVAIKTAYKWLHKYEGSQIPFAVQESVKGMRAALKKKKGQPQVLQYLEGIVALTESFPPSAGKAEAYLECGYAAYQINDLDGAVELLIQAVDEYGLHDRRHGQAVAQWMLGCVFWDYGDRESDAILAWQNSLDNFNVLSLSRGILETEAKWYAIQVRKMRKAIKAELKLAGPIKVKMPPSPPPPPPEPEPAAPRAAKTPPPHEEPPPPVEEEEPILFEDFFQIAPIVDEINAGTFQPLTRASVEYVQTQQVLIDGRPHSAYSLVLGEPVPNLKYDEEHVVMRVVGDSMDQAEGIGIAEDDYVLLRKTAQPNSGSIVAAEIDSVDTSATLKRYTRKNEGQAITLSPESANPIHQAYELDADLEGQHFHIGWVALAVFKPI